ncbi:palmitoyltransferase [Physocladia obscura]|uniref:Palmitoyltransferase n=1 Tax=Physocladia obscura TaxID=109957 RepID=A0AAD5XDN5_9FUNG|nr:palmitoyltransferase [Physocladia obscura]
MPKVFSIAVADTNGGCQILAAENDLMSFNYFQRGSVQEFLGFFIKTAVERTQRGMRQKIEEQQMYVGHVYVRSDGLAGVIVTDIEYPTRSAFTIVNKILDEFSAKFPKSQFAGMSPANTSSVYPELKEQLVKYQDPHAADPLLRVQRDLDETKIVLHKTMESLLNRGEVLDDLVQRSDQLSSQSKMFYKTAKSTNSCCTY